MVHDIQQLLFLADRLSKTTTPRESSLTLLSSFFESLCQNIASQSPSPRITVRIIPPAILHPLQFPSKLLRHPQNLATVELFSPSILFTTGIHFPPVLLHNQGYPKVCPDPLNLPNAGDPFAGTSLLTSHSLFSPTRDLIASI
jgi:hypothetical protein